MVNQSEEQSQSDVQSSSINRSSQSKTEIDENLERELLEFVGGDDLDDEGNRNEEEKEQD